MELVTITLDSSRYGTFLSVEEVLSDSTDPNHQQPLNRTHLHTQCSDWHCIQRCRTKDSIKNWGKSHLLSAFSLSKVKTQNLWIDSNQVCVTTEESWRSSQVNRYTRIIELSLDAEPCPRSPGKSRGHTPKTVTRLPSSECPMCHGW